MPVNIPTARRAFPAACLPSTVIATVILTALIACCAGPARAGDRGVIVYGDDRGAVHEAEGGERPWLGVAVYEAAGGEARSLGPEGFPGVVVSAVGEDSPAGEAGLSVGDVILMVNGTNVKGVDDFISLIQGYDPGDRLNLEVSSDGRISSIFVTLGRRPDVIYTAEGPLAAIPGERRGYPRGMGIMPGNGHGPPGPPAPWGCVDFYGKHHGPYGVNGPYGMADFGMTDGGFYGRILYMGTAALGLDPAQEKAAGAIRTDLEKDVVRLKSDVRIAEIELATLLRSEPLDLAGVREKLDEIGLKRAAIEFAGISGVERFRGILTDAQLEEFEGIVISVRLSRWYCPGGPDHGRGR